MCGILGVLTKDNSGSELFRDALQTLSHRGPDSEGIKEFPNKKSKLILGQKRLAIIDLNPSANQPMADVTGDTGSPSMAKFTIIWSSRMPLSKRA